MICQVIDKFQPKPTENDCTQGLDMLPKHAECYDGQRDHNAKGNIQLHIMHVCRVQLKRDGTR